MGYLTKIIPLLVSSVLLLTVSCVKDEGNVRQVAPALTPFDPDNTPVRWNSSAIGTGLTIKVSTSFTDDFPAGSDDSSGRNPIEQMMKVWNDSTSSHTFFRINDLTTSNKEYSSLSGFKNDGEMGIYRSNSWYSNVSSSALAITQYFGFRRNAGTAAEYVELSHADIIVNYDHHTFTLDPNDTFNYDLKTVILHELGHFIGLGHTPSSSTGAVMLPSLSSSQVKNSLTSFDTNNIRALYGVSSLSANQNIVVGHLHHNGDHDTHETNGREGEEVSGIIELRSDGDCRHYLNDKLISTHKVKLK